MDNITIKLALIILFLFVNSTIFAMDKFSQFACKEMKMTSEVPKIMGMTSFSAVTNSSAPKDCKTLLVFENQETAVVKRTVQVEKQTHDQIVIVSTLSNTVRPIIGRSTQFRNRATSRSYGEGGGRGGTTLPTISEQVSLIGVRSLGHFKIGMETFQIRFRIHQEFRATFNSTKTNRRDNYPLVEFDLCGRKVSLDAGIYPAVARRYVSCENYTDNERKVFDEFWKF